MHQQQEQAPQSRCSAVCPEHVQLMRLFDQFYDKHCKAILCPNCFVLGPDHRGHECVTLDVAAAGSRASLERLDSARCRDRVRWPAS